MDKYEYRVKTEQMLEYMEQKAYGKAMEIADTIDWRKVKNASMLCSVSEIYEQNEKYEKSRDVLFIAYDRTPGSRKIIYRLGILALKLGEPSEAMDCYEEFVSVAPKDPNQYILRYKILKAQNAPITQQIEVLEEFKKAEYIEKWAYELAKLYDEAGMITECLEECDDLILWFSEGKYVYQAMELKMKYKPLTPLQQEKYDQKPGGPMTPSQKFVQKLRENQLDTSTATIPTGEVKEAIKEPQLQKQVTGQMKIEEILASWEEKQKEVMEVIEQKRQEAEADKEIVELKSEPEAATPEDVRRLMEELEGKKEDEALEEASASEPMEEEAEPEVIEEPIEEQTFAEEDFEECFDDEIDEELEEFEELDIPEWDEQEMEAMTEDPVEVIEESEEEVIEEPESIFEEMSEEDAAQVLSEESEVHEETELYEEEEISRDLSEGQEEMDPEDDDEDSFDPNDFEEVEDGYDIRDFEEEIAAFERGRKESEEDDDDFDLLNETIPLSRIEVAKAAATGKTGKIPVDEIANALGATGTFGQGTTGFTVQAKYDLEAQSEVGLRAGLTEEQKKLFSYFVPVRGMSEQLVDVLEQDKQCTNRQGTSKTGNLLIIGRKGSGKTVLAVDVVKAIQKQRKLKQGKVAIITGDSLNKKKIKEIVSKLYGGALIIEKAGRMNEKTVQRLNKAMERDTGELLIVLEEQRKPLDRLLSSNKEFRRKFTSRLEVPIFINDELVTFGQTYAKENGFKIDEVGILALYSRIDMLQREDHVVTVAEVKEIMDEAIEHVQKTNVKKIVKRVLGKGRDDADRVLLSEKDFNI
ncbi:ATP-binding protein [Faecalimonas umbilicata]|uniref:ATP-binding protein n=1 Tax=Faecalimonas umbilicata TaxID=1912855 RepID=UPI000E3FFA90|nr:ATP-binding protein [Faecalimonas umbilicata]RGC78332.1 AAA family ATPase [Lachnospiraceae bacterium AM25-17]RJU69342.1 AAA family ATPase [Coprococcus sp. AM27-12LB]